MANTKFDNNESQPGQACLPKGGGLTPVCGGKPRKSTTKKSKAREASRNAAAAAAKKKVKVERVLDGDKYDVQQGNVKEIQARPAQTHLKLENFDLRVNGKVLFEDANLTIHEGAKVGLAGRNGKGKSSLLKCLAQGLLHIPTDTFGHIQHVNGGVDPCNVTSAFECVCEADQSLLELQQSIEKAEQAEHSPSGHEVAAEAMRIQGDFALRADRGAIAHHVRRILHGLGFTQKMQDLPTSELSGGMRMRVSLARALVMAPQFLLLDEPTNHLDFASVLWLEEYLQQEFQGTLLVISHDRDFLDEVCDHMLQVNHKKITAYRGNYTYMMHEQQKYAQQQGVEMLEEPITFSFPRPELALGDSRRSLRPGLLVQCEDVSFHHEEDNSEVLHKVNFKIPNPAEKEEGAIMAIVGANGGGKTTFLELLSGKLQATSGVVVRHGVFEHGPEVMYQFNQHFVEQVAQDHGEATAVQYLQGATGVQDEVRVVEMLRSFGMDAERVTRTLISELSGGERVRLHFALLSLSDPATLTPRILLMDEPTNHLDTESVGALAQAIKRYTARSEPEGMHEDDEAPSSVPGTVILVSHDVRLLEDLNCELYVCGKGKVERYHDGIRAYKEEVLGELQAAD